MTFDTKFLSHLTVGISISESPDIAKYGFGLMHLQDAMVEVARYLLASGAQLAYGGSPEYRGLNFLDTLIQLAKNHNKANRVRAKKPLCLATAPTDISRRAELYPLATFIEIEPPQASPADDMDASEKRYAQARHLTRMREGMNQKLDARIILGGRTTGFAGAYPGLVEEAYLALKTNKAVYLMGTFGGCGRAIINAVKGETPDALTEASQFSDAAYAEFVTFYNSKAAAEGLEPIDYPGLLNFFAQKGIDGLNNGLTPDENDRLFETTRLTEMISLILKGLKRIKV
jgi:hypothetical protein